MAALRNLTAALGATTVVLAVLPAAAQPPEAPPPLPAGASASSGTLLEFDQVQATTMNGPAIAADETRVCGAPGPRRFLAELLQGNPIDHKIPYRLGDVLPDNTTPSALFGRQYAASGEAAGSVLGAGDFPFDHPYGSDFNMDVTLDAPYANLSQAGGVVTGHDQHVELSAGLFPHTPQPASTAGDTWSNFSLRARQNLQPGYVPQAGDRVITMGRWVNDCGHPPFQTELHPLSFMAWARESGPRTVAQAFYAPYRETQLYNADPAKGDDVHDLARYFDPLTFSFPAGLVTEILALNDAGPPAMPSIDHLFSYPLMEANTTSAPDWWVCAPPGTVGQYVGANWDFRARPGVEVQVYADHTNGCVLVHTALGSQVTPDPTALTCTLPWDELNQMAAEEAGVPGLDLQNQLGAYVFPQFKDRLDAAPLTSCYDPVQGPSVSANPAGQDTTTDGAILSPLYGRIEVFKTDVEPTLPTAPSTTASTPTTPSSSSSSSTPAGQTITVSPATVAQGGVIAVQSGGWAPGATVTVTIDGTTTLGTLTADTNGNVSGSFTVPSGVAVGDHRLQLEGTGGDGAPASVSTGITVTAAAAAVAATTTGSLPQTGSDVARTVAIGAGLVLAGLGLVAGVRASRRRSTAT